MAKQTLKAKKTHSSVSTQPERMQFFADMAVWEQTEQEIILEDIHFELCNTAKQYTDWHGEFQFSRENLQEMADNFNANIAGRKIAVDLNHSEDKRAYAWMKPNSAYVAPSKILQGEYALYAQLYEFTPEGRHLLITGAYKYFSIEVQFSFTRIEEGKKKEYKNVLTGLAITNAPAVKDLAPAFSENNNNSLTIETMELFKIMLSDLLAKSIVSKDAKELMKNAYAKLSEEEQEEAKADVEALEAKPEEEEKQEEEEEKKEETQEEEKKEEVQLSEAKKAIVTLAEEKKALEMQLSEAKGELRKTALTEEAKKLCLSVEQNTGFKPADTNEIVSFMLSLSDEQTKNFMALMQKVVSCDLSEVGSAEPTHNSFSDYEGKVMALTAKILGENKELSMLDAKSQAILELEAQGIID